MFRKLGTFRHLAKVVKKSILQIRGKIATQYLVHSVHSVLLVLIVFGCVSSFYDDLGMRLVGWVWECDLWDGSGNETCGMGLGMRLVGWV